MTDTVLDRRPDAPAPGGAARGARTPEGAAAAGSAEDRAVAGVAERVITLMRTFNKTRARMMAAAAHDVEWSAHVALQYLRNEGPMRAGELAEHLHSDPSTVSRQVAALVRDGLIERRADPDDGRASLLVLTDRADAVLADHDRIRLDFFAEMLAGWSAAELNSFEAMLHRFTDDYTETNNEQMAERVRAAMRTGGKH